MYTVTLTAKSLKTMLVVKNEDEDTFEFNTLLHTYFKVPVSLFSDSEGKKEECSQDLLFLGYCQCCSGWIVKSKVH